MNDFYPIPLFSYRAQPKNDQENLLSSQFLPSPFVYPLERSPKRRIFSFFLRRYTSARLSLHICPREKLGGFLFYRELLVIPLFSSFAPSPLPPPSLSFRSPPRLRTAMEDPVSLFPPLQGPPLPCCNGCVISPRIFTFFPPPPSLFYPFLLP